MRKILAILMASAFATAPVYAVKIADITRIDGQRTNKLTGIGLVTGLKGTGDGGDYLPAIRPLAVMLGAFSNETEVRELGDVPNIALVGLSVTLPKDGVHIGDQLDVQVTSWGKATSLKNGSLVNCPMMGPKPEPNGKLWAMAQGLVVVDDPTSPTSGVIKGGCTVERSLEMHYIFNGKLKLFLEDAHASWTTAGAIAQVINDSEANGKDVIAIVIDPKTVEISIPLVEREQPGCGCEAAANLPLVRRRQSRFRTGGGSDRHPHGFRQRVSIAGPERTSNFTAGCGCESGGDSFRGNNQLHHRPQ